MRGPALNAYWFPVMLGIAIAILGSLPYAVGYLTEQPDEIFMGFVGRGTPGANGYFMLARQAQEGHWLMENQMTPEPVPRAYFNLQWLIFGGLARWTGLSLIAMFHIWRVLSVIGYACALYYLAWLCLGDSFRSRLALLLTLFGSGLGWVIWIVNKGGLALPLTPDLQGACTFGYLVNNPHFIRSGLFAALTVAFLIRGDNAANARWHVASGLAAAGYAFMRPYQIPETFLLYALFPVLRSVMARQVLRAEFRRCILAGLVFLPVAAYVLWTAKANVLGMEGWYRQSYFLLHEIIWKGLPFFAVCAYFVLRGLSHLDDTTPGAALLGLWMGLDLLFINAFPYFPAGQELAFYAFTIAPPILLLTGPLPALGAWVTRLRPDAARFMAGRGRLAGAAVLVLACAPSSAYVYGRFFTDLHAPVMEWRYYLGRDVVNALAWMDEQRAPNDVVLASHDVSQFIPRLTRLKVVSGHDMLTPRYYEKNGLVLRFFEQGGDDVFKRDLVRRFHVRYVLYGPDERRLGAFNPLEHKWLEKIHDDGSVAVYRVRLG